MPIHRTIKLANSLPFYLIYIPIEVHKKKKKPYTHIFFILPSLYCIRFHFIILIERDSIIFKSTVFLFFFPFNRFLILNLRVTDSARGRGEGTCFLLQY